MGRLEDEKNNHDAGVDLVKEIRKLDQNVPYFIYCSRRPKIRFGDEAKRGNANGWRDLF